MSIAELGQYILQSLIRKFFEDSIEGEGLNSLTAFSIGRLKVQICLFNSDTATTISSVKTVLQLVLIDTVMIPSLLCILLYWK